MFAPEGTTRRVATVFAALAIVFVATACGGEDEAADGPAAATQVASTPAPAATQTAAAAASSAAVRVTDDAFTPLSVTVRTGSKVTWTWGGSNPHSVVGTFDGENVRSPTLTGSGEFSHTFTRAGRYQYVCGVHGESMSGSVTVQ